MRSALFLSSLAACQAVGDARPAEVVLRDDHDTPVLALSRTATGCATDENLVIIASASADRVSAGAWTLAPGPTGRELRGPAGLIARLVDDPGTAAGHRLTLLDPVGVPMIRLSFDGEAVTLTDAARAAIGAIARTDDGFRLTAGDRPAGRVTGTTDLEVAARLLAPATLPPEARALFACDRFVAVTPAAK